MGPANWCAVAWPAGALRTNWHGCQVASIAGVRLAPRSGCSRRCNRKPKRRAPSIGPFITSMTPPCAPTSMRQVQKRRTRRTTKSQGVAEVVYPPKSIRAEGGGKPLTFLVAAGVALRRPTSSLSWNKGPLKAQAAAVRATVPNESWVTKALAVPRFGRTASAIASV